jgi:hypothetical protein
MPIARLDRQQVLGALKSTGSSDPDVLYARKEELLTDTRRMKMLGTLPIIIGVICTITIIGAVAGIPALIFGIVMRRRIKSNFRIADEVYAEYVGQLPVAGARAATA